MTSHINKLMNTITNKSASFIGRENLTNMSNSINKIFSKAKYRDFLKAGNTIQLISRNSHRSLQICASQNDPNRLILNGQGQVGTEYTNSHFVIETEPKHGHLKFRNRQTYIAFDQDVPCVLSEPLNPKHKSEYIRARNEFRIHEIIGSDEYFALESVYYPGKYISILPNGDITVIKNKADESTHFYVHIIHVHQFNGQAQAVVVQSSVANQPSVQSAAVATNESVAPAQSTGLSQKEEESREAARQQAAASNNATTSQSSEQITQLDHVPPAYASLYPKLPQ